MSEELPQAIFRAILESLPTGVYVVNRDRRILVWNDGAERLTGYLRHEAIGRCCREDLLIHCDENRACLCDTACPLQQTMHDGRTRSADMFLLHKHGQRIPVHVSAVPVRDEDGAIVGAVECFEKRTLAPAAEALPGEPNRKTSIDAQTGLPDRRATLARLRAYLDNRAASPIPFGVASISVVDLEHLRQIDGGNAVNAVLHATGQTLANALGPNDMIGRWSGDRFLAVVTSCTEAGLRRTANTMKRLVRCTGVPWWGDRLSVTLSVGAAIVRPDDTLESLVERADAALDSSPPPPGEPVVLA